MDHRSMEEATYCSLAGQAARHARPYFARPLVALWLALALAALPSCGGGGGSGATGGGGSGGSGATGGAGSGGSAQGGSGANAGSVSSGASGGSTPSGGSGGSGGSAGQPGCASCGAGTACVNGACARLCTGHSDCEASGESCTPAQEDGSGTDVLVCQARPSGVGIGTPCPFGNECPQGAPACVSAGPGDATAYCSIHDCMADADCPGGFYCGVTRDPHEVCGSNPKKGDNAQCGKTNEPCVDPAADPTTRFEGSLCLLRKTCLYREQCAPCASDLDCSARPYQACATIGGEKRCARQCGNAGDCLDDESCTAGVCVPKFGACKGTGQFCEPCVNDTDCGGAGTTSACARLSEGQRACFDHSFSISCNSSADCPVAKSGKHGYCLDIHFGVEPGDPNYHKCYLPIDTVNYDVSCW